MVTRRDLNPKHLNPSTPKLFGAEKEERGGLRKELLCVYLLFFFLFAKAQHRIPKKY
jgi:hypothetical protein